MVAQGPFGRLYESLRAGQITRREFIEHSTALGVAGAVAIFCANAAQAAASGGSQNGFAFYAQSNTAGTGKAPDAGTQNQKRGAGPELRLIQWQAASIAVPHTATGTKDYLASCIVLEPLMHYLEDGSLIPNLVKRVPSVENGLLAKDLSTVTFELLPNIKWSDGQPFTAKDIVFTWQWITFEGNASVSVGVWQAISKAEAKDDHTVVCTFASPAANWFEPFAGGTYGAIYPAHKFKDFKDRNAPFDTAPIGTGPYKIDSFKPGDQAIYSVNDNYREPNKPYFKSINMKGGGDAASAARAVLETGEEDFAWNLQVEPAVLKQMESGGKGKWIVVQGTSIERININFSDPNKEVNGQRSEMHTPHPIFTDDKVRQAMNLAVQRDVIANQFYGPGQPATANILAGLKSFTSTDTKWEYNLDQAGKLLDEAGWKMEGDVRKKDGQEFSITYATSINQVRQKTQAVVKQAFTKLGIKVQLQQVDATVFFDGSAGNTQNINHMYTDINMYTNNPSSPIPVSYMFGWYSGKNGSNIAQKSNQWQGQNFQRWINKDYDALYESLVKETDAEKASAMLIQMNDLIIHDVALIPEVNRAADSYAIANTLNNDNIMVGPGFELDYWNIANWNRP